MRRKISGAVILGLVTGVLMLALPAQAHSFTGEGDCDGWTLHLDGTWNAYDITVDGVSIGLEQNPQIPDDSDDTSRTFVVRWWKTGPDVERTVTVERVLECGSETTTTLPEETTTTIPEETTTIPEVTTTVPGDTTTTVIGTTTTTGSAGSFWSASSECQTLTAEWGDGISQVDVSLVDPQFGEIQVDSFTTSGEVKDATTFRGEEWVLVPVTISGFTAVPDEIHLFTEVCTTTTAPTTSSTPELPFTGDHAARDAALAGSVLLFGVILLTAAKGMKDDA